MLAFSPLCQRLETYNYSSFHNNVFSGRGSRRAQRFSRARYREVNGEWRVTLEEGDDRRGGGNQADPMSSPQDALCINGQNLEANNYHLPRPNTNIDVESIRSFDIHTNSLQNSGSHLDSNLTVV